jgi:hypothetical protein
MYTSSKSYTCMYMYRYMYMYMYHIRLLILYVLLAQDIYHTTHQCFYSQRSLYLALFRLQDGRDGVNELEPWLRTIQVHVCTT